jgi:YfiH family protein
VLALGKVRARWTGRQEGDLRSDSSGVDARRRAVLDRPWSLARQVHGADYLVVEDHKPAAGPADALVTTRDDIALAVLTADCGAVVLGGGDGIAAAVHVGWRGLVAGVLPAAVEAMRGLGAGDIVAGLGPCIRPECYEFGAADLAQVAASVGGDVEGRTSEGHPALDLPRAIAMSLERCGVGLVADVGICTACSPDHFSHRARGEAERQALVVWRVGGGVP